MVDITKIQYDKMGYFAHDNFLMKNHIRTALILYKMRHFNTSKLKNWIFSENDDKVVDVIYSGIAHLCDDNIVPEHGDLELLNVIQKFIYNLRGSQMDSILLNGLEAVAMDKKKASIIYLSSN